jgi:hypothetical protein
LATCWPRTFMLPRLFRKSTTKTFGGTGDFWMSEARRSAKADPVASKPELPSWHLGVIGAIHRRDIYDDDH